MARLMAEFSRLLAQKRYCRSGDGLEPLRGIFFHALPAAVASGTSISRPDFTS